MFHIWKVSILQREGDEITFGCLFYGWMAAVVIRVLLFENESRVFYSGVFQGSLN